MAKPRTLKDCGVIRRGLDMGLSKPPVTKKGKCFGYICRGKIAYKQIRQCKKCPISASSQEIDEYWDDRWNGMGEEQP